jgi:transporter family-2 protein
MMPTQGAINSKLATYVHSPLLSSFISFAIGTIALLLYILIAGIPMGQLSGAKQAPLIAWTGGLLGAFFVTAVILSVPRIGVAMTFSLVILGQMLATLPIDHSGFLGVAVREVNLPRIIGVFLIICGVILIRRF